MKRSLNRLLALLLTMAMLLVYIPAPPAKAADVSSLTYVVENEEVTITDCSTWASDELVIPDTIEGYPVTAIANRAFDGCWQLTSVTIPEGVTVIGASAFSGCVHLSSINIPQSVTEIGGYAFFDCENLYSISIPGNVSQIHSNTFYGCISLVEATIAEGVDSIGDYAFYNCSSLYTLTIPSTVTSIGTMAFYDCMALHETVTIPAATVSIGEAAFGSCNALPGIFVEEGNPAYCSDASGVLYTKDMTTLVQAPGGITGAYVIPEGVTNIGKYAFCDASKLTSVTIPSSLTHIGEGAFSYCENLAPFVFSDPDIDMGSDVFLESGALNSYDNCRYIGIEGNPYYKLYDYAPAEGTTPETCQIHPQTKIIGDHAFENCTDILTVTIPEGVTTVGEKAFSTIYVYVNIPATVSTIENYGFEGCYILSGSTLEGLTQINEGIFKNASWGVEWQPEADVTIPDGITHIGDYAFDNCVGIANLYLPESLISIGRGAFSSSSGVHTIPKSVSSIGVSAFAGANFYEITIEGSPVIGDSAFYSCNNLTIVTVTGDDTVIGKDAFASNYSLETVTVSGDRIVIGEGAFKNGGPFMETVTISGENTVIGDSAFENCSSLQTATIGEGVTGIGNNAFLNCSRLSNVSLPNTLTSIGGSVFSGCTMLSGNYDYKGTGSYLGNEQTNCILLLKGDSSVKEISPDTKFIGEYAFMESSGLTEITIPSGVKQIGYGAFMGCGDLKTITFEGDAPIIGDWAFGYTKEEDNEVVATAYYPLGNPTWTEDVMQDYCGDITWVAKDMWYLAPNMEYLEYTIENGKVTITNCDTAAEGTLAIPAYIEDCPVTAIGGSAFSGCSNLTEITIPASVTSIGYQAFYECSSLTSIKIPDSVTVLGEGAFWNCTAMTSAVIGNGVTAIESMAFYSCDNLSDVTIGSSVTSIGENAFGHCYSLSEVTLPDSVTSIGKSAFYNCYTLTDVTLGNSVETIGMDSFMFTGVRTIWLPASVRSIGVGAFNSSDLTAYQVAEDNQNYSNDGQGALLNKGKDMLISFPPAATGSYTIPDSVVSILANAFEYSELTSVTVPASVTHIGNCAFACMNNLSTVYFLGDAPSICEDAFEYTYNVNAYYENDTSGWTEDVMQDYGGTVTWLVKPMSYGNLMYSIENGNAIITGFVEMPEGKLVIPAQIEGYPVTEIMNNAFYSCYDLTALTIPESVTTIGDSAFGSCTGLTEVTLSEGITAIGGNAFDGCTGLTEIALPDSLTTIGDFAFWGCTGLTTVTIPAGVTSMGIGAFGDCGSLTAISVAEGNTTYCSDGSGVVFTKDMKTLVMAPDAIRGAYTIPNGVTGVAPNAFMYCSELTELTIPDSVTTVEGYAFMCCTGLTTVTISAGITSLADGAFANCLSLGTVYFRGDAPTFGYGVFDMWEQPVNDYITAYYPTGNATWTEDVMYNCSDRISWVPYEVEVEPTGTTILGSLKSFGDVEGLTVELWLEGAEAASYTAVIDGDSYSFTNVPAGSYTLKISKENGVTRTYPIEAGTASVSQDVAISPLGDVNGDTKVNIGDVARIYAHVRNTGKIEDEYALLCSDVTGDQRINIGDVARTYSHVKGTNPLW